MAKKKSKKKEKLESIRKNVNKEYGGAHLEKANNRPDKSRISTGSITGDVITGGGFVVGAMHWLWGWESCGKTTQALLAVRNAQNMCSDCWTRIDPVLVYYDEDEHDCDESEWREKRKLCNECNAVYHEDMAPVRTAEEYYDDVPEGINGNDEVCESCGSVNSIEEIDKDKGLDTIDGPNRCECGNNEPVITLVADFEGTFDKEWAQCLGVDLDDVVIEEPPYGEAGLDVIDTLVEEGAVDIIVIDSIAAISTSEEMDTSHQKSNSMANTARLINRWLRGMPAKMADSYNKHGTRQTVFAINQIRESTDLYGGHKMFGGHGQKFFASTCLKFLSQEETIEKSAVGAASRDEYMGIAKCDLLKVRCEKNKTAPTRGMETAIKLFTANYGVFSKGEIDDSQALWKYGKKTGVIYKKGNDYTIKGWPERFKRKADLLDSSRDRPHLKHHISKQIVEANISDFESIKNA